MGRSEWWTTFSKLLSYFLWREALFFSGNNKKELTDKWLKLITDRTMGTRKRSREQSHSSTRTRTRAFTFLLSPTSGRPTDLQTKREKVLSVTCLPTIGLAVFRILILSWKNRKDVNKLRYIFQRSTIDWQSFNKYRCKYWSTRTNSAVWPVPCACAQPYHSGSGTHGQLWCLRWSCRLKEWFCTHLGSNQRGR